METITLTKKDYNKLVDKALRYDFLKKIIESNFYSPPPRKDINYIIKEFQRVGKYNNKFLSSLEKGLKRSKESFSSKS